MENEFQQLFIYLLQGIRCEADRAQYERLGANLTLVHCLGKAMLFLELTREQYHK